MTSLMNEPSRLNFSPRSEANKTKTTGADFFFKIRKAVFYEMLQKNAHFIKNF